MLLFRLPTLGKLLLLVATALPIVTIGGFLLHKVSGLSWQEAVQQTYYVLNNVPGTDITSFSQFEARLVLNLVHVVSLFTFATLVGLFTEDVRETVDHIRRGNFNVPERDHTVVLGCNAQVVALLREILNARTVRGGGAFHGSITVLSSQPKAELDELLDYELGHEVARQLVIRHGNPMKASDLERVAAGHAHTVIIMRPEGPQGGLSPEEQQQVSLAVLQAAAAAVSDAGGDAGGAGIGGWASRLLAGLYRRQQQRGRRQRQRVVVEQALCSSHVTETRHHMVGDLLGQARQNVTYLSSSSSMCRVSVQCATQPGLAAVFEAVVCRCDDVSLLVQPLPSHLVGATFAEARRAFPRAVVCGYLRRPQRPQPGSGAPLGAAAAASGGAGQDGNGHAYTSGGGASRRDSGSGGRLCGTSSFATIIDSSDVAGYGSYGCGYSNNDSAASTGSTSSTDDLVSDTPSSAAAAANGSGTAAAPWPPDARAASASGGHSLRITFCPPDDLVLGKRDKLVLLAANFGDCKPTPVPYSVEWAPLGAQAPPPQALPASVRVPRYGGRRPLLSRLLLLAHDSVLTGDMLGALEEFCSLGCTITVVSPEPCRGVPLGPTPRARLRMSNVVGSLQDPQTLVRAQVAMADALIITGLDALPPSDADALVIACALLVQRLLAAAVAAAAASQQSQGAEHASLATARSLAASAAATAAGSSNGRGLDSATGSSSWDLDYVEDYTPGNGAAAAPPLELPRKPLTFVCTVQDPHTRRVLQHIAAVSCRAAAAAAGLTIAEAAGSGGSSSGSDSDGGIAGGGVSCAARQGQGQHRWRALGMEIIQPPALRSGMLAQVAADPRLVTGLEDLLDDEGYELYIKRPDRFGLPYGLRVSWAQVSELAREQGDVALGFIARGKLLLAPPADTELELVPGDKLVVIAEGF